MASTYASGVGTPHLGRLRTRPPAKGFFVTLYPNVAMPIRVNMFRLGICLPEAPGRSRILQCGNVHPDAPAHSDFSAYHCGLAERYERVYEEDRIAIEAVQRAELAGVAAAFPFPVLGRAPPQARQPGGRHPSPPSDAAMPGRTAAR